MTGTGCKTGHFCTPMPVETGFGVQEPVVLHPDSGLPGRDGHDERRDGKDERRSRTGREKGMKKGGPQVRSAR